MKVKSKNEAWEKANIIFPTDYIKDEIRSQKAGYDIYYSTADGINAWISDLGGRLEINLSNGETVNIWIENESQFTARNLLYEAYSKIEKILKEQHPESKLLSEAII